MPKNQNTASDTVKTGRATARSYEAPKPAGVPPVIPLKSATGYDAQDHTGLCGRTIRRAVARNELAAIRVGRAIRFRTSDLDAWLDSQTVGAPREVA